MLRIYIYSNTVLKHKFNVFVLYLNISIFSYLVLSLSVLNVNIVLFTLLHLFWQQKQLQVKILSTKHEMYVAFTAWLFKIELILTTLICLI